MIAKIQQHSAGYFSALTGVSQQSDLCASKDGLGLLTSASACPYTSMKDQVHR